MTATGNNFCRRSKNAAAQSAAAVTAATGRHRLMIGGEIERDAGAERHRHPGQQPPGAGFGARSIRAVLRRSDDQVEKPDGAKPPARAASRGGHVPAIPCVRALLPSAIPVHPRSRPDPDAIGSCEPADAHIILHVPRPLSYGCGTGGFVMAEKDGGPGARAMALVAMSLAHVTFSALRAKGVIGANEANSLLDGILDGLENILPSDSPDVQEARELLETIVRAGAGKPPGATK